MSTMELFSLPKIEFAHVYQAEKYQNRFLVTENLLEITYIAEGELAFLIGNQIYHAAKGDVICNRFKRETTALARNAHCHHTVALTVDWKDCDDLQNGLLLPMITPAKSNTASICKLIDVCIHNQVAYKASREKGATKCLELLCEIDNCNRKAQNAIMPSEQRYVNRAKEYIQQKLQEQITQQSIAEYLGISREYLCAIFKKTEGTTIMQYINRLKLESIKAFMEHTNAHLYEAATIYGYSDPNYVSRLHKQIFGYNITDNSNTYL